MKRLLKDQLSRAEELIEEAAFSSVTEIPAVLSRAVHLIHNIALMVPGCIQSDRELAVRQLQSFHLKLSIFSCAMRRSEAILQAYARNAGISLQEYGPVGISNGARDPSFFDMAV